MYKEGDTFLTSYFGLVKFSKEQPDSPFVKKIKLLKQQKLFLLCYCAYL